MQTKCLEIVFDKQQFINKYKSILQVDQISNN